MPGRATPAGAVTVWAALLQMPCTRCMVQTWHAHSPLEESAFAWAAGCTAALCTAAPVHSAAEDTAQSPVLFAVSRLLKLQQPQGSGTAAGAACSA